MPLPFNPVFDVDPDALVESEVIEFTGTGASTVTLPALSLTDSNMANFELLVNGTPFGPGTSTTVNPGDMLQARGNAPSGYQTAAYGHIIVDYVGYVPFGVMTKQDPSNTVLDPNYADEPQSGFFDGYSPSSPQNKLLTVNTSDNSASATNLGVVTSPDPATIGDGKDYLFAADYPGNRLHRIDPATGTVVHTINVNKPFGLAYSPTETPVEDEPAMVLVSSPADGKVYVFDETYTLTAEATTGAGPHGVCGERSEVQGDYGFWVACADADRVEHWYYTNGVALVRDFYYTLEAGAKPYDVSLDADGNAWVTCLGTDKVAKCPAAGGGTVEYFNVGESPWGISVGDTHAYVACASGDVVSAVQLADGAVTNMPVFTNPTHVEKVGNSLYVGSFNFGTLADYPLTTSTSLGTKQDIPSSQRMFEGIVGSFDAANLFALNQHNDLTERTALTDLQPDAMTFISQSNVGAGEQSTSNTITVADVDSSVSVYAPGGVDGILDVGLNVNGSASSIPAVVDEQDTIAATVTTPTDTTAIPRLYIPIFYPGGVSVWVVSMTPGEKERVAGWIQGG